LLNGTVTFATITSTAMLLALLEPIFAAVDAERLLLVFLLLAFLRSPLWLIRFCGNGRTAKV
jgi:hypothetical protein